MRVTTENAYGMNAVAHGTRRMEDDRAAGRGPETRTR